MVEVIVDLIAVDQVVEDTLLVVVLVDMEHRVEGDMIVVEIHRDHLIVNLQDPLLCVVMVWDMLLDLLEVIDQDILRVNEAMIDLRADDHLVLVAIVVVQDMEEDK